MIQPTQMSTQSIRIDVLDRGLETHLQRRLQLNAFAFGLTAHVRQMFRFGWVTGKSFGRAFSPTIYPGISVFLWSNEQPPAERKPMMMFMSTRTVSPGVTVKGRGAARTCLATRS